MVREYPHHPLVEEREKCLHGIDVLHPVLSLLEPGKMNMTFCY